ncbi:MAG: hypothetical protein OSA06_02240 [Acidimicrobiales bacterium]|nr:hypothetical protein [Acidimicrobiales bacterium]
MTLVDAENIVTLKVPPSLIFAHLPRMALTTLLRIHRISPSDLGDLSADLQKATENLAQGNADISVDFLVTDQQVVITLKNGKQTKKLCAEHTVSP